MIRIALLLLFALVPGVAHAEWREASTRHFLVYSEGSEAKLREVATKLEKYDFILRWGSKVNRPASAIKLKIYLVPTPQDVQAALGGGRNMGVLGFYDPSMRGPYFVGLERDPNDIDGMGAQQVLFHEYTHHFMFQYFPAAYPSWYSEGFAEFYGTTRILDNDAIELGHAALARYYSLTSKQWLPLEKMLAAKNYEDVKRDLHLLYAQGWLLVHYLANTPARAGQLDKYLALINAGQSFEAATDAAFGKDAKELDSELRAYARKRAINATRTQFKPIDIGPLAVRTLSPAEDALIKKDIELSRGILVREAAEFAEDVRKIAGRYPQDPYALRILTEAERAAGNTNEAMAALDRWLALQPRDPKALTHRAQMQVEALASARSTDEQAWNAARQQIVDAIKLAPDDPFPLIAYYDSFRAQNLLPPAGAQNGLYHAFELMPQVPQLRQKLASDFEQRNMIKDAIDIIKPAAYALHSDDDKSESEKRKEAELKAKNRVAGEPVDAEEPWQMLDRLEKKLESAPAATAAQ
ncbi:tetratricopeptide repeat protein [Sphingosinicella rhizophila]|uniref:DUF1570 domain-containing protein n=1 Tax=Sphingosinicella rhizophila TaxID=3050082 RepID=A0ABU3Q8R1_9SPHN|nr:hypothetical protein [Sphingosinicella sp. GR2756]MDT9599798.1 hypothetical protein [Sphingosinicella sp. GR2756]